MSSEQVERRMWKAYAACSFGLEAVVAAELRELGITKTETCDARVYFCGGWPEIARANLCLRAADRVYLVISEFTAERFDELFDGVTAISWQEYLPKNARFPVLADSVHSTLKSVPDIQSISKKAVVESLKRAYGLGFYREDGEEYAIYVSILKNRVSVCLNTSGIGLNRRGYRVRNSAAPLRETLAAGLIALSRWRDRPFYNPFCGSGTIAIEAALCLAGRAPGLKRSFAAEKWGRAPEMAFTAERRRAQETVKSEPLSLIYASDIDPKMVEMAKFHARRAGVLDWIHFSVEDARDFCAQPGVGTLIANPPYAIRLGEKQEVSALYRDFGKRLSEFTALRYYIISADEQFERSFGRHADKKRKLYNGNIRCYFYQYFRQGK